MCVLSLWETGHLTINVCRDVCSVCVCVCVILRHC